jgi:hypothetical protein
LRPFWVEESSRFEIPSEQGRAFIEPEAWPIWIGDALPDERSKPGRFEWIPTQAG